MVAVTRESGPSTVRSRDTDLLSAPGEISRTSASQSVRSRWVVCKASNPRSRRWLALGISTIVTVGRDRAHVAEHTYELDHRRFATHVPMSRRPLRVDATSRYLRTRWSDPRAVRTPRGRDFAPHEVGSRAGLPVVPGCPGTSGSGRRWSVRISPQAPWSAAGSALTTRKSAPVPDSCCPAADIWRFRRVIPGMPATTSSRTDSPHQVGGGGQGPITASVPRAPFSPWDRGAGPAE